MAGGRRLEAAGGGAVAVAEDDGAAQVGRDGVGGCSEVEGQADGGGEAGQGAGAQERGDLSWAGQQRDRVGQDEAADRVAVRRGIAVGAQEFRGELVEQVLVDAAGDDRDDGGVAGVCGRGGGRPGRGPESAGPESAGPVVSLAAGAFSGPGAGWLLAWPVPWFCCRRPGRCRVRWPG